MQLISKYNKGIMYLLCAVNLFSKYAWVVLMKEKKGVTIVNAFQKILDSSKRKPNSIWVDQDSECYNNSFKKWRILLKEMKEGKSVVAEKFIKTLKNKIYKNMTAVSKKIYFDVLNDIVDKYNNTLHRTIEMKPIDVKSDSYDEYNVDSNEKDSEFKVACHVRISKYKNIFAKGYTKLV